MKFKLNYSSKIAGTILLIGMIMSIIVYFTTNQIISTYQNNLPYISLGDNIKNKTTKGHLWFEEYMAGDDGNDFQKDILSHFTDSKEILHKAIDGGSSSIGEFSTCNDPVLKSLFEKTILDIDNLIHFTIQRNENKLHNKELAKDSSYVKTETGEEAGGKLDQEFDEAYEKIQIDMEQAIELVDKKVDAEKSKLIILNVSICFGMIVLFILISAFIYKSQEKMEKITNDNSQKLLVETNRLEKMQDFVSTISTGNFDIELHTGIQNDNLAISLSQMKEKLKNSAEEDRKRNWVTNGIAILSDTLRKTEQSDSDMYHAILTFLVKYLNANQAGLFIVESDPSTQENYLELKACYAFNRKKFLEKRIETGQGLVGQCYLEKDTIVLSEIPDSYVSITSGLGESNPNMLIITPLKVNEVIYGVLEIASFNTFEAYQIQFIEKLAENVGAVISNVKTNQQTRRLLEESQEQSEALKSQEEEMRQNMEELTATQEEMGRKEKDYIQEIVELKEKVKLLELNKA